MARRETQAQVQHTRPRAGLTRSTLEVEDLLNFIGQVHPLKLYSSHMRRSLCEQATLVTFKAGQKICQQGEQADAFLRGIELRHRQRPNR